MHIHREETRIAGHAVHWPLVVPAFGIGAMSVFVVVPHPKQVPRSRVVLASCPLWARLSLIKRLLLLVRASGGSRLAGAIPLFDTYIIYNSVAFVYKLW